jgi:Spy/CpxP family protein refolding chaperone
MEYIRREAGLTPHEYEAVAKIIRRYDRERFRLIRQRRQTIRALKKGQKLDAAKANTILDQLIEGDQKLWQLKIRYYKTLRQVLSPQKALAVIRAESSFRRRLVAPKRPSGPRVLNKRRRRPRFK